MFRLVATAALIGSTIPGCIGVGQALPQKRASLEARDAGGIDRVHVVWMNHLDVGFTNNIASVLNIYFHEYFTKAIETAKEVNKPGEPPVFRYTSHAWLLDIFLNCPQFLGLNCPMDRVDGGGSLGVTPDYDPACVVCPNASLVEAVEQGIRDDVITWHAFPFNAEPELADAGLLLGGIDAVHALDARFGKPNKTVISQRDVPGVTRGIVPLMRQRGLVAFSEGCNAQIMPPSVPPIFNWTDTASGDSIVMLLHPRGYGVSVESVGEPTLDIDGEEEAPAVCPGLQGARGFGVNDVVQVPGFNEALVYAFKSDNQGPPSAAEVHVILSCIHNASGVGLFPGSSPQIVGSTFDAFVSALLEHPTAAASLPVITQEIGDTWIYGSQSDPKKMKLLRLMMRARSACTGCDFAEPALRNFTRLLLKPTEHTFGLHGLGQLSTWDNQHLHAALADHDNETSTGQLGSILRKWADSWVEQRLYPEYALAALTAPDASAAAVSLHAAILGEMHTQWPVRAIDTSSLTKFVGGGDFSFKFAHFSGTVSATTGGLSALVARSPGAEVLDWSADGDYDLFQFVYRSLNQKHDFTPFRNAYTGDWKTFSGSWFTSQPGSCYDKTNLDNSTCSEQMGCAKSQDWSPAAITIWYNSSSIVVEMTMPAEAHEIYGAPAKVYVSLHFSSASAEIDTDVRWIGKTPTRLPESTLLMMPLSHCPDGDEWLVDKLGSWVAASDVVSDGGAAHLHAVGQAGAKRACGNKTLHVVNVDSALISVGHASPFPTPLQPLSKAQASGTLAAVLHNNIWDVNYPMWYPFGKYTQVDANERFRFKTWWA